MLIDGEIIEIFCKIDDFAKEYYQIIEKNSLSDGKNRKRRKRKSKMSE